MRMLKSEEEVNMASQSGIVDSVRSSLCFQSLLGFFFNKGVRGGPKVLLNLAGVLLALIIFVKLLPQHMTESALSSLPQSVWSSVGSQDDSVAGGLRIVVFGENDIGTPVGMQPEYEDAQSWTQALCEEVCLPCTISCACQVNISPNSLLRNQLQCTNHISMIPSPETAPYSISSNELYAYGIDKVLNETHDKTTPGYDYSYVSEAYPPQWKSSDLKAQVDKFLAMPKPRHASGETVWVFSFGLWDVWSLSSLPIASAKESVEVMTKDIFAQIERLYVASQDPTSIAYSDISTIASPPTASPLEDEEDFAAVAGQTEKREEAEAQVKEEAEESSRPVESFRILVPRIADPSILPGWRDLRPDSPAVHSKAEQMRNSYALTNAWNDGIGQALTDWVKIKDSQKEEEKNDEGEKTDKKSRRADLASTLPRSAASPPTRDGYAYNLADYLLDALLERQMRNAKLTDGNGRGKGELEEGFRDVRNACLQPLSSVPVSVSTKSGVTLNLPYKKIDGDKQALTPSPAANAIFKRDGEGVEAEEKPSLGYMSTAKVCAIPSDHLFYTPFALSQKAILEIAAETAEMIRGGETVRSKLGL